MKLSYINIYDFAGRRTKIYLPDKEIDKIYIKVLTGDETGYVEFEDGTLISFDASAGTRRINYYDGEYTVFPEQIQKWEESIFNDARYTLPKNISYRRMHAFVDSRIIDFNLLASKIV